MKTVYRLYIGANGSCWSQDQQDAMWDTLAAFTDSCTVAYADGLYKGRYVPTAVVTLTSSAKEVALLAARLVQKLDQASIGVEANGKMTFLPHAP